MKIAFCILDNMLVTSLSWPSEMWLAAQSFSAISKAPSKHIDITLVSAKSLRGSVNTNSVVPLHTTQVISSDDQFDLIYIPALWRNPKKSIHQNGALSKWLHNQYDKGAAICGTGSGVFFIAESELINHKPATTHWYYFDQFSNDYPNVLLKRDHFITEADNIYCAASINSLADLTIHHIEKYFGKTIANHIQRHFSHEMRAPYENKTFSNRSYFNHEDEGILHIQLWLEENFDQPISINKLAKEHGMSERTLSRRFKKSTRMSPLEFLQKIRINRSKELISKSNLSLIEISEKTGFYDASHFSRTFKKYNDLSPKAYRQLVRRKLFKK